MITTFGNLRLPLSVIFHSAQVYSQENPLGAEKSREVESKSEKQVSPAITAQKKKNLNLVLLYLAGDKFIFIPSRRVEAGEQLTLQLLPENPRQSAFLANLQRQYQRQTFGIAFNDTALQVRLEKATSIQEESNGYWQIVLQSLEEKFSSSALSEFSFNNYTPEDIAELRAKRILLNELPEIKRGRGDLTSGLIESFVRRNEGLIQNIESPLPFLYQQFRDDIPCFLEAARLMCVLYLQLTGVVEHIFTLNLEMKSETEVFVEFEGQRPLRYVNAEPHTIKFEGICNFT